MRKLYLLLALVIVSCSPQGYSMLLETRHNSPSGLDLGGKKVALIYMENENPRDTVFNNFFADGIRQRLGPVLDGFDIYSLKEAEGGDYSEKDTLVNLVLNTEADVVMLLDCPEYHGSDSGNVYVSRLYVYDSMDKKDEVKAFARSSVSMGDTDGMAPSDAQFSAYQWSEIFVPEWKQEQFTFLYYDLSEWVEAIVQADAMELEDAMNTWLEIAGSAKSPEKISCASYNIALCNYLLSRYDLAEEWLDMSDKIYPVSLSPGLRKRISEALR